MSRILLVTERFWPESFIINDLVEEFARRGDKVVVLTQQPSYPKGRMYKGFKNNLFSRESWRGAEILRIKTILGYKDSLFLKLFNYAWFAVAGSFASLFIFRSFDVVYIYHSGPLTMAIPGIMFAKTRNIPIIIWTQDIWPDSVFAYGFKKNSMLVTILNVFVGWVYNSTEEILISCNGFKRKIEKYTQSRITYAPNWPLANYNFKPIARTLEREKVFLFAGNVGMVQNLHNVILGYKAALRMGLKNSKFRIVGDGSALKSLKEIAELESIAIEFAGRKTIDEMQAEYDGADFLILSLSDAPILKLTIPSKFQMYLSVGKPILCIASGEVARLVEDSKIGIIAEPTDTEAIGKAFLKMVTMPMQTVDEMRASSQELLRNEYDKDVVVSVISKTIAAAIERHEVSL